MWSGFLPPGGELSPNVIPPGLQMVLDTLPAFIFIAHDTRCRFMSGNRAAYELLRLPPGANISKSAPEGEEPRTFRAFRDGREIAPAELPVQRAARGEEIRGYEFAVHFSDGEVVWVTGDAAPLRDAAGVVRGALGAFVDITARKADEAALTRAKEEAERANRAKSRFLAAASHDLRQPLQALALYHEVLAGQIPEAARPTLDFARACTATLSEQLDDLLDLQKLDSGIVSVQIKAVAVSEVISRLVDAAAPLAAAKGLALRHVPSAAVLMTDPLLLERLLMNLLSNAVKYTERGGVLIGCRRRGHRLRIEVVDTGIGVPQDKLREIFDEFAQLNNPGRDRSRGSGLGLAIVERTARLLAAPVTVRSVVGRGSTFAVELPLLG